MQNLADNFRSRRMDTWFLQFLLLIIIQLCFVLCEEQQPQFSQTISTRQMDVTTPLTTIPTHSPTSSATPVLNPTISNPNSPASTTTPTTTSPASATGSWCVASQSAPKTALQVALDYACGYGNANCSAIQPSGGCYNPNTLRNHASYAFNDYYQKNPIPTSCTFGGTGITTSTDPSYSTCRYPSTSTSSSILNISNSNGSTVFGAGPNNPSSSATIVATKNLFFIHASHATLSMIILARNP